MIKVKWLLGLMLAGTLTAEASDLVIQSFGSTGQLTFSTLNNGTNYDYRVEWAPTAGGPWNSLNGSGTGLDHIWATQGSSVTSAVPMCYRVVATPGDYLVVDISGGANAVSYPVAYYRALADVPGGADSDVYKTTNLLMRLIPKGTFTMGSPTNELGRNSDEIQHQVTLSQDFYIGVYEVTQKQWERVMGTWPSYFGNVSCRDARPVEQVGYSDIRGSSAGTGWPSNNAVDATSFMGNLRAKTRLGFDLPTESQWEYAGRAGTMTALNSGYNLANTSSDAHMAAVGRYWYNGGSGYTMDGDTTVATEKVGSYLPNQWGLYDMEGNVCEWCLDWYGDYPGTVSDPKGPGYGKYRSYRVDRGSAFYGFAKECRTASRAASSPNAGNYGMGFRVALPSGQ